MNGRSNNSVRRQPVHQKTYGRNVRYRVHCTDFVKMNVGNRNGVGMAFRFRDQFIDGHNMILYMRGKGKMSPYDVLNIMQVAVVMRVFVLCAAFMTVEMLCAVSRAVEMFVFFLPVYSDGKMRAGDAAFHRCFFLIYYAWNSKSVQFIYKSVGIGQKLKQSRGQHISGRAHLTVQI